MRVLRSALGSDSPLTSAGDLLDEIRTAQTTGVSPVKIYDLVTSSSARVLGLSGGEGAIRPRTRADLPWRSLIEGYLRRRRWRMPHTEMLSS